MMMKRDKDREKEREAQHAKEKEEEKEGHQDDQFELQAGEYVHKFNEICRQHKMDKPDYKWKYEKVGNKKKVKYYISQDQLGICVKVSDRSKAYAKLQSVKLAYEEAVRVLLSKQHQQRAQLEPQPDSDGMTAKFHEQFKNIDTLVKADKKELPPALQRVERDIDVFLDSESKIYSPAKNKSKTGSVESNPIEYAMIRKGHNYFDIATPAVRAPPPLPSVPLPKRPTEKLAYQPERSTVDDSHSKDDEPDTGSTLRISSGFAYQSTLIQNRKEIAEDFVTRATTNNLHQLNNVHTIRSRPRQGLLIQADLDIEMLLYLETQRKLLAEAAERAKNKAASSNTNFLRILNLLLLQNDKISIEIKISSDFGMLSKREFNRRSAKEGAKMERMPEKMNERVEKNYKLIGMKSSESSVDSGRKTDTKKPKAGEQVSPQDARRGRDGHSSPPMQSSVQTAKIDSKEAVADSKESPREESPNHQIVWLSRLNCFYLDCCFTTVLGAGKTTGKSINDAAIKMLIYLNSLVNF